MDYYQAGTGKIKTKIATEQQAGQVAAADLLWVGDASDYLTFKASRAFWGVRFWNRKDSGCVQKILTTSTRRTSGGYGHGVLNTQNVTEEEAPKHWRIF